MYLQLDRLSAGLTYTMLVVAEPCVGVGPGDQDRLMGVWWLGGKQAIPCPGSSPPSWSPC
jgi:hypothetical protein